MVTKGTLADFLFNHVLVTVFDKRKRTAADMEQDDEQEQMLAQQDSAQVEPGQQSESSGPPEGPAGSTAKDPEVHGDSEEVLGELSSSMEDGLEGGGGTVFDFSHIVDPKERKKMFRSKLRLRCYKAQRADFVDALLKRVHGSPQGHSSLNQCICAIISLYEKQKARAVNPNTHDYPVTRQIITLKVLVKQETANRTARRYEDKGKSESPILRSYQCR